MRIPLYSTARGANAWLQSSVSVPGALFVGDCEKLIQALPENSVDLVVSSPPYCMGKVYEKGRNDLEEFVQSHRRLLPALIRSLKPGGSLCWQVGYHVSKGICTPLDFLVLQEMCQHPEMKLRNRIAWTFRHGLHATNRFSGRHEIILWFTKGKAYEFDLNSVRVGQKYPGKRHSHGPKKGELSGNPLGANPGDVWDIPNVKANHVEKTSHPCQFPVGLVQRLIRALTDEGDVVLDPFAGVGSAGVAALMEGRRFLGAEIDEEYVTIARLRLAEALAGTAKFRPADRAIHVPRPNSKVAKRPASFATPLESTAANQRITRRSDATAAKRA